MKERGSTNSILIENRYLTRIRNEEKETIEIQTFQIVEVMIIQIAVVRHAFCVTHSCEKLQMISH